MTSETALNHVFERQPFHLVKLYSMTGRLQVCILKLSHGRSEQRKDVSIRPFHIVCCTPQTNYV